MDLSSSQPAPDHSVNETRITPDGRSILAATSRGDIPALVGLFESDVAKVEELLRSELGITSPRAVYVFLMEAIPNAFAAAYRNALMAAAGISHDDVLALKRPENASRELIETVAQVIGPNGLKDSESAWARLELLDNQQVWLVVRTKRDQGTWETRVENTGSVCGADLEQLRPRFADPETAMAEVKDLRARHTSPSGRVSIPSTTGGGALGILKCLRQAERDGLRLSYGVRENPSPVTYFSLALI